MFQKIRLHKLGLFCAGSDDIVRLITFEYQDGALQEANNVSDIMEINAKLGTIIFNQTYNSLFICSTQGVDVFDLVATVHKSSTFVPTAQGKIVDIGIINPTSSLIVTVRDSGALEAWSIIDGSRKFSILIENQIISHMVTSPILPFIVVTSTTGIFNFFEINTNGFRFIHRIRVHSNDINCIKFNPRGTLLVSAGIDNSLFLMEIKIEQILADNIFQIIYRTDLDGEPFALDLDDFDRQQHDDDDDNDEQIDELNKENKDKSNETRIIVALNTKTEKFGRFFIIDFDWQQYFGINKKK